MTTTLLLVLSLRVGPDSLPPKPSLLAPPTEQPPTFFLVPTNPLAPAKRVGPGDSVWWQGRLYLPAKPVPTKREGGAGIRRHIAPLSLAFVAGASWGLHETISHHWPAFERRHPGANAQWWNPAESWRNKYRHGDPESGRTAVPVQITDAKHFLVLAHNTTLFGAGVCVALGGKRRKWWRYALDAGAALAAYSAGNFLTYNILYRPP